MSAARSWLAPPRPPAPAPPSRRLLVTELLVVFTVTLGLSGVRSLLSLLDALRAPAPLSSQTVALNAPAARADLVDLAVQLTGVLQLVGWGALGGYLLVRGGLGLRTVGLDGTRLGRDAAGAAGLAVLIGVPGLGLYLLARTAGANLTVLPSTLGEHWWRLPVLVLAAVANAWAEELLVVGYLLTRLRQLGWTENRSVLTAAALRGSYHLYQGFGGFAGNLAMGLVFGRVWQRTNRLWVLVGAHALIDVVAFTGFALLHGRVPWLP